MEDYKLEEEIRNLECYYNIDDEAVSKKLIEEIIFYIHSLENEIYDLRKQIDY
jgi:hypothetical protein